MGKALEGVRVLDMTHVQSGPTCTQILAWFGADSLYFTMLNSNKRGMTLNPKTEAGKKIFAQLIEKCDVMVENYAPGAIDRIGFPWEKIQPINPRMIYVAALLHREESGKGQRVSVAMQDAVLSRWPH